MKKINPLFVFACIATGLLLMACVPPEPYHEHHEMEEYHGPEHFFKEGMEDFRKGEFREAIEHFEHAIQMRPGYVEAYYFMGQAYENLHKDDPAEKAYKNAVSYDQRYLPAREALGLLEFEDKEYKEAEKQLEAAIGLGSTNAHVFYAAGRIDLSEKECRKAIKKLKEALRLDPDFHDAREWLDKAEDRCGESHEKTRTDKSFKGGGKAIKPED